MFISKSSFPTSTLLLSLALIPASACFAASGDTPAANNLQPSTTASSSSAGSDALPDAPKPQRNGESAAGNRLADRFLNEFDPGYDGIASRWDVTINKGEKVQPFTGLNKIHFAFTEEDDPASLFTASLAAGYEHLRNTDPHFGTDKAGYGERLGAAAFRQGVNKMIGDGVLAALTHEDPRYYRVADGSILSRAAHSAEQTVLRHRDDGTIGINYSGLAAHALADGLPITFYPQVSAKTSIALEGFGTSLAADAGLKLAREFLPDIFEAIGLIPKH